MKTKLLLIIIFCVFSIFLINTQTEEEIIKATSNEKYWKRHFFDLCVIGGSSFGTFSFDTYTGYEYGGLVGMSFGYQYAFTDKFAFGPGFSGFLNIPPNEYYRYHHIDDIVAYLPKSEYIIGIYSGGALMFMFMFGDLKKDKVAVLLDIGGGLFVAAKLGFYIKGFVFKTGYAFAGLGPFRAADEYYWCYGHHLTFDLGYKFNWKRKIKEYPIKK